MSRSRPLLTAVAIATVLALGTFVAGTRLDAPAGRSTFGEIERVARELQESAARPVPEEELVRAAIEGMLEILGDPYAANLSPQEREEVDSLFSGSTVGIGVWVRRIDRGIRITGVVDGSPADRRGLRSGDVIVRVDGRSVRGMSVGRAGELIRGPRGETVTLVIHRPGDSLTVTLRRDDIDVANVESRALRGGSVGYVRLLQFGRGAGGDLRRAVRRLRAEGAGGIVLDLRGNTGGLADEAIEVAGVFLDGGVVTRIRHRGDPEEKVSADPGALGPFPMAVLVDRGTASASELVAGALQDRDRATVVGTRTFGKGSVVTVRDLGAGRRIQFTSAFFVTPDGHRIEGRGIRPDVRVAPGATGDSQLRRAVRVVGG